MLLISDRQLRYKNDRSLSSVRTLADNKMDYSWENGLIFLASLDDDDSPRKKLESKRKKLIEIAYDKSGHVGSR